MSNATNAPAKRSGDLQPLPGWMSGSLIGLVLGIGGTLLIIRATNFRFEEPSDASGKVATSAPGGPAGGMGGGMMGGGPGGGMMGMGGGGARGKRNLTSLVGKIELLTREPLHVTLNPEQAAQIAAHLAKLEQAEKMTSEEAQTHIETIEALFSPEQKAVLDSIGLPFGRPGGGGPGGPGGGMPGMGGGGAEDENPFRQEINQKRLSDLLGRISPNALKPAAPEEKNVSK